MNILNDRDNLFLFFHLGFSIILFEIWVIYYVLLCYLTYNMWWDGYVNWIGIILGWVGL